MARPLGRDERLLRTLYAEHGGPLLGYAERLTGGDRQQAEDVVQETLVRAWRNAERLEAGSARPWLFRVARNIAIDRARARRSRMADAPPDVAAALAVAAVALVGVPLPDDDGRGGPAPLTAAASDLRTGVHGSAELTREPWGTRVELSLAGVRPGERCRLVARSEGGRSEVAATWRAGYLGTAEVPGAVAIPADRVASLEVVTAGDRVLVRMPVTSR
jgi:RNA polymerase sigma factor (sigma-70 family)